MAAWWSHPHPFPHQPGLPAVLSMWTACEAANLLASEVPMQAQLPVFDATVACANFPNCSSVHCSAVYQCNNYSGKLYFLPCKNPPGVRLVLDYNSRAVHVDRLINRNTTIPFVIHGLTVDIIVPLIHQMDGPLLFAVRRLHAVDRCMCCSMLVWGVISVVTVRQNAEHTLFWQKLPHPSPHVYSCCMHGMQYTHACFCGCGGWGVL